MHHLCSLLFLALSASTTLARLHGHERRHVHHQLKERQYVTATIDGTVESWIQSGTSTSTTPTAAPTTTSGSTSTTGSNGFGGRTSPSGSGDTYCGNVGIPYGSNIIQISEGDVNNYQYVIKINACPTEAYTVGFWNKIGPQGGVNGFFGHAVLNFQVQPGDVNYVAIDEDSQGAFGSAPGNSLPTTAYGSYSCTWGEWDFGSSINDGYSGFDVSAIPPQDANQFIQGLKMYHAASNTCSSITEGGADVNNAYTTAQRNAGGIGGNLAPGSVFLEVNLCFQ